MAFGSVLTNKYWEVNQHRMYTASPTLTAPTVFQVGINSITPSVTDTGLTQHVPISGTTSLDACDATTSWTVDTDSAVTLNTTNFIEGTGSLSIAKSGTAGTTFGMHKTLSSQDFTSKDLWCFVYLTSLSDLVTSGTAITIRYGSDSSNYYYKNIDAANITTTWNSITFSSSTATGTTGSPTIGACVYFRIILNVTSSGTTVAADRVLLDDIKLATSASYTKAFEAGSPGFDTTNYIVTVQGRLLSTQCNGQNLTAFSLWNTDSPAKMLTEDVHGTETKSSTDEFLYEVQDRKVI